MTDTVGKIIFQNIVDNIPKMATPPTYDIKIECCCCHKHLGFKAGGTEPDSISHTFCDSCLTQYCKEHDIDLPPRLRESATVSG